MYIKLGVILNTYLSCTPDTGLWRPAVDETEIYGPEFSRGWSFSAPNCWYQEPADRRADKALVSNEYTD